jgi:hypothetical protein
MHSNVARMTSLLVMFALHTAVPGAVDSEEIELDRQGIVDAVANEPS